MDENVEKMINALGGLAELCYAFFSVLIKQGFSKKQALELVTVFLDNTMDG